MKNDVKIILLAIIGVALLFGGLAFVDYGSKSPFYVVGLVAAPVGFAMVLIIGVTGILELVSPEDRRKTAVAIVGLFSLGSGLLIMGSPEGRGSFLLTMDQFPSLLVIVDWGLFLLFITGFALALAGLAMLLVVRSKKLRSRRTSD